MTLDQIRIQNREAGFFFFEPDTMRFFNSRVHKRTFEDWSKGLTFFVTSEKCIDHVRKYTVRVFNHKTGAIDTVGEFQAYQTRGAAINAAKRAAFVD